MSCYHRLYRYLFLSPLFLLLACPSLISSSPSNKLKCSSDKGLEECGLSVKELEESNRFLTADSTELDSSATFDNPLIDSSGIDPVRLGLLASISAGSFVVGHAFLSNLWWKGQPVPFHFEFDKDWSYALGADKFGHAIMSYLGTDLYRQALAWTGFENRTALWISSVLVWSYMTYIEIRDGFSIDWGFSWGDMAANTLGIGWRLLEEYEPAFKAVTWKASYWPSDAWRAGLYSNIIDDYESTYHWASIDPELFMPKGVADFWPDWLNIALAHTVSGVASYDGSGSHQFVLALDIDTEGFGVTDPFWSSVLRVINYYHIPMPAIRFGHGFGFR